MREIKFRGLNANGEWVYGDLVKTSPNKVDGGVTCWIKPNTLLGLGATSTPTEHFLRVDAETVGQFIGIQCDGGCDLYGGDIVDFYQDGEFYKTQILEPDESGCVWVDVDGFDYDSSPILSAISEQNFKLGLIGNIHQNPELKP